MRQTFTLNSPTGKNDWTIQFKKHLTIPAKAKLQVNFIQVRLSPGAGYLETPYALLTDLPINTFFSSDVGAKLNKTVENNLMVYVPIQKQAELSLDDPLSLPTNAGFTYEPHVPLIHEIQGSGDIELNSMHFRFVDGDDLVPYPEGELVDITISFTIMTDE